MLCRERIRFVFYRCGFDPQTGRRQLSIGPGHIEDNPQVIADLAADHLARAFALDTAQWRLWVVGASLLNPAL